MFIIQRQATRNEFSNGFNLVWAFQTQEELFDFFHEDSHPQLKEGLENLYYISKFDIFSAPNTLYQVSLAVKPFYMK